MRAKPFRRLKGYSALAVVIAFSIIGVAILVQTRAATPFASTEVENGQISGNATKITDVAASGGSAISFNATASPSPYLPFDMPSTTTMRATGGKVFAHYWPALTRAMSNQDPTTKADAWYNRFNPPLMNYPGPPAPAIHGGMLRDQPIPRAPRSTTAVNIGAASVPSWRIEDSKDDVRDGIAAGLDGFAVDIMCMPGCSDANQVPATRSIVYAAGQVDPGFKIMLMLDMNSGYVTNNTPQTDIAKYLSELVASASSSIYRVDGRVMISTFKGDKKPASWYTSLFNILKTNHGIDVTFMPVLLDDRATRTQYTSISSGMGFWGDRSPQANSTTKTDANSPIGRINAIKGLAPGMKTFVPVAVQDVRPRELKYDESLNTTNLRNMWQNARTTNADYVQIITWSDYYENTHIMPSKRNGYGYIDLNAYFLYWFKFKAEPSVVRDRLYISHRTHPINAQPTAAAQTGRFVNRSGADTPRDAIEVVAFLTADATIEVTSGGVTNQYPGTKGMNIITAPFRTGAAPSAKAIRNSTTVQTVTSAEAITGSPFVQDPHYIIKGSAR